MPAAQQAGSGRSPEAAYWDSVVGDWREDHAHRLWRAHSDAVNIRLLRRWLPAEAGSLLKTDLFDEAVGDGLYPELASRAEPVIGIDISPGTVQRARQRYPDLDGQVADVRRLPFAAASFDTVVSNSTLDHFDRRDVLARSLGELARVIRPGGALLITLDNRLNPVIALRTSRLLARLHRRLGIVPYFVGVTCGAPGLRRLLHTAGFEVAELTAIMHWPPQLMAARAVRRTGSGAAPSTEDHVRRALRHERLERWPTRHLTAHFVAARAVRRWTAT